VKLHRHLFNLLILFLPTQLAYHFWPDWAFVFGIRVDYLAPKIFFTDVLVVALLISWLKVWPKNKLFSEKRSKFFFWLKVLLILGLINVFFASVWQVALFGWLKLVELIFLGFYVKENWYKAKESATKFIGYALIYTAVIVASQLLLQRTVNGPLYYLGERTFSASTPGIALMDLWGRSFLRPYATFPHPNVLAGFILVAITFLTNPWLILVGILVVIVSFSQAAWLTAGIVLLLKLFKNSLFKMKVLVVIVVAVFSGSVAFSLIDIDTPVNMMVENIDSRIELAQSSGEMFANAPFIGVGLGNFVTNLSQTSIKVKTSWWLQPVHNIYLLVLAEVGLVGLLIFFYVVLRSLLSSASKRDWKILSALLIIYITL